MLVGYVSDERYVAVPDALVEFERDGESVAVVRSSPRGGIYADVPAGEYRVTLAAPGFGSKVVEMRADPAHPYQFRLLSDTLLGYVWPRWVRTGERSEFRVHSPEPYRLSLWRYGYRKEFIRLLGWFDEHGPGATVQVTPDGDYVQTGVQWNKRGYGSPHHTQFVTGPERSGLYYLEAEGESGAFFSFPWVVAPAKPRARIAVVAATNTWNAYNNFGGRSHYVNSDHLPPQPIVNARVELRRYRESGYYVEWQHPDDAYRPLSFERPEPCNHIPKGTEVTDPIRGRQPCHLAPAEWRVMGWLEREGYEYDLYSDYHLHSGALDLDAYQMLIVGVHNEYWSGNQYRRVKDWVFNRSGRLIYMAGNGLNCEVEYPAEGTMRCIGQMPPQGGEYESRLHRTLGESEAALLGVVFTDAGIMTSAPYRALDTSHWAFRGTGLKDGDVFGTESLHERIHGGASGHETDKMSPSTPANAVCLARGLNPEQGGGEIVYHEPGNGGAVYSVGSITYGACLLVDEHVSQITRNVIDRFMG